MPRWLAPFRWCLNWLGFCSEAEEPERRFYLRHPCCLETCCSSIAQVDGDPWPAKLRNLSHTGISLILSRFFEPGAVLTITLKNQTNTYHRTILVKVIHSVEHPSGEWILGGVFTRKLTDYDLKTLLDGPKPLELPKLNVL